jgi:hypothetical protein
MTLGADGRPVTSVKAVAPGEGITTLLADGRVRSTVDTP